MAETQFKQVPFHAIELLPCAVCASDVVMWQMTESETAQFFVACTLGDHVSPLGDDCPLYHPPSSFYRARRIEAAQYWNEWMKFGASRRKERAERETSALHCEHGVPKNSLNPCPACAADACMAKVRQHFDERRASPPPVTTFKAGANGCEHCGLSFLLHIEQDEFGRKDVCQGQSAANR